MNRNPDLPTSEEQEEMEGYEQLASLLLGGTPGGLSSAPVMQHAASTPTENPDSEDPNVAFVTRKCQSLEARLSLIEGTVGRLCTILGKLEQELEILKNK